LAKRPPCHPCDLHACDAFVCLPDLSPTEVVAAARDLFDNDPPRGSLFHGCADGRPEVQP
jgi:hypothetical protein